jgi:hypothetical protein
VNGVRLGRTRSGFNSSRHASAEPREAG